MEKNGDASSGIATSRSRRAGGAKKASRAEGLEALKAARAGNKWGQDEELDNVYDLVDENEYSEMVSNRQNEGWIVEDDGEYVEDGREIFDEEMGDESAGHRSTKGADKKAKKGPNRRKADANATSEDSSSSSAGKNIKNMLLNMGSGAKRKPKAEADLQNDETLKELLGQVGSSLGKPESKRLKSTAQNGSGAHSQSGPHHNPFAVRPSSTGLKKIVKKPETPTYQPKAREEPSELDVTPSQAIEDDDFSEDIFDEPMEVAGMMEFEV